MNRGEKILEIEHSLSGWSPRSRWAGWLATGCGLALAWSVAMAKEPSAPSMPGGLRVTAVSETEVALSWSAPAAGSRATGFKVTCEAGETTVSGPECRLRDLEPGTTYRVTVRSRDDRGGWSASCPPVTVTTKPDRTAPSVPAGLRAEAVGETRFTLTWRPAKDNVRVVAYEVFQDGRLLGSGKEVERTIRQLTPGRTYRMTVRAGDAAGNWSSLSEALLVTVDPDRRRPTPPSGLMAGDVESSRFRLSWRPSTDNVGVTGYEVRNNGVSAGTTAATSLRMDGLQPNTNYRLVVRARDAAGNWSKDSAALEVRTAAAADRTPPTVPTQLREVARTATGLTLVWSASADDSGSVHYEIFQNGTSVGRTSLLQLEVHDLVPATEYRFAVRAGDNDGNWSALSAELLITLGGVDGSVGFEAEEGFRLGPVDGQLGWSATAGSSVVDEPARSGRQALRVVGSVANRGYPIPEGGIVFTDLFAQPVAAPDALQGVFLETESTAVALVRKGAAAELYVCDGDGAGSGTWFGTGAEVPLAPSGQASNWLRLTLRTDLQGGRWDLFVDGRLVAVDLGAIGDASGGLGAIGLSGDAVEGAVFDDLLIAPDNPVFADTDRDGMDDAWELAHGLDSQRDDRKGDLDGDGVPNIREFLLGTDPRSADSDGDSLADGAELELGTHPAMADSDGDGLPDGWELAHGLDPLSSADGQRDDDGDGVANAAEVRAGTNPFDFFNGRAVVTTPTETQGPTVYSYDRSGRLTQASYPAGWKVRYDRDAAGNLTSIATMGEGPMAEWRSRHGLPADGSGLGSDGAMPAGDGLTNLEKYAFGLDPMVRFDGDLPVIDRVVVNGAVWLVLKYQRPTPAPLDVDYAVESTVDGLVWTRAGAEAQTTVTAIATDLARVEVRLPVPAGGTGGWRARLNLKRTILP